MRYLLERVRKIAAELKENIGDIAALSVAAMFGKE